MTDVLQFCKTPLVHSLTLASGLTLFILYGGAPWYEMTVSNYVGVLAGTILLLIASFSFVANNEDSLPKPPTFDCQHCGESVIIQMETWIDSGTTLACSHCGGETVIDLFTPEKRKQLYSKP